MSLHNLMDQPTEPSYVDSPGEAHQFISHGFGPTVEACRLGGSAPEISVSITFSATATGKQPVAGFREADGVQLVIGDDEWEELKGIVDAALAECRNGAVKTYTSGDLAKLFGLNRQPPTE